MKMIQFSILFLLVSLGFIPEINGQEVRTDGIYYRALDDNEFPAYRIFMFRENDAPISFTFQSFDTLTLDGLAPYLNDLNSSKFVIKKLDDKIILYLKSEEKEKKFWKIEALEENVIKVRDVRKDDYELDYNYSFMKVEMGGSSFAAFLGK